MTDISDHDVDKLRPNGFARQLRVRATPEEHDTFTRAAKLSGVKISSWVRMALRAEASRQLMNVGEKAPWV